MTEGGESLVMLARTLIVVELLLPLIIIIKNIVKLHLFWKSAEGVLESIRLLTFCHVYCLLISLGFHDEISYVWDLSFRWGIAFPVKDNFLCFPNEALIQKSSEDVVEARVVCVVLILIKQQGFSEGLYGLCVFE